MGAIIVLIASFVAIFTFSGISRVPSNVLVLESGRVLSTNHRYEPPARKSIIVDTDGMEHPTADNTHLTRRDRSRKLPLPAIAANVKVDNKRTESGTRSSGPQEPIPSSSSKTTASVEAGPPALNDTKPDAGLQSSAILPPAKTPNIQNAVHQYQVEEAPLAPVVVSRMAPVKPALKTGSAKSKTARKISLGRKVKNAILAHPALSKSARLTLTVTSFKGKVTLRGIVVSRREKNRIGALVGQIVKPKNVINRLIIVSR